MRSISSFLVSSLALLLLLQCGRGGQQRPPETPPQAVATIVPTPGRQLLEMDPIQQAKVRETAEAYLKAFLEQNFDVMWAMTEPESKKLVGLPNFVRQNQYREAATIFSSNIETIGGLAADRALVVIKLSIQRAPSMFEGNTDAEEVRMEEEWQLVDGSWYRVIPQVSPEDLQTAEDICAEAQRQGQTGTITP